MNPHLEHAIRHWVKTSEGWMTEERALEMAELVLARKPETCLECGVFGGRSLIAQALALKENGHGKIFGVDPWKLEYALEGENADNRNWWTKNVNLETIHQYCMQAIWKYGLDGVAIPIRAASQHVYDIFENIDHLFIDGCHSEISSVRDVVNYLPLVRCGGLVIFDDANWDTTQKALSLIDAECNLLKDGKEYRIYEKR